MTMQLENPVQSIMLDAGEGQGVQMSGFRPVVGAASAGLLTALLCAGVALASNGDDCPPNPEPGKCYEKVLIPAHRESWVEPGGYRTLTRMVPEVFEWRVVACGYGDTPAYGVATSRAPAAYAAPRPAYREDRYGGGYRSPDMRVAANQQVVMAVQTALGRGGYYDGPCDGVLTSQTEYSLARFQRDRQLPSGWTIGTLQALGVSYP
jgi:hypothetical protein